MLVVVLGCSAVVWLVLFGGSLLLLPAALGFRSRSAAAAETHRNLRRLPRGPSASRAGHGGARRLSLRIQLPRAGALARCPPSSPRFCRAVSIVAGCDRSECVRSSSEAPTWCPGARPRPSVPEAHHRLPRALRHVSIAWPQHSVRSRLVPASPAVDDERRRLFDIAGAGGLIVASSPFLALAALAIKLTGGPVLYRQTRVGKDGRDFGLLKLRTMVVGAETIGTGLAVNRGDARITRGRILRRLSLDELPQLRNVVQGEMSLIRPRQPFATRSTGMTTGNSIGSTSTLASPAGRGSTAVPRALGRADRARPLVRGAPLGRGRLEDPLLRTPLALFGSTYKGGSGGWNDSRLARGCLEHVGEEAIEPGRLWLPAEVDDDPGRVGADRFRVDGLMNDGSTTTTATPDSKRADQSSGSSPSSSHSSLNPASAERHDPRAPHVVQPAGAEDTRSRYDARLVREACGSRPGAKDCDHPLDVVEHQSPNRVAPSGSRARAAPRARPARSR